MRVAALEIGFMRRRPRDPSWLISRKPPGSGRKNKPPGMEALWWAVIKSAAWDLRYSHEQAALDALDFLRVTGVWLISELWNVPINETQRQVVQIVMRRNRSKGNSLPV